MHAWYKKRAIVSFSIVNGPFRKPKAMVEQCYTNGNGRNQGSVGFDDADMMA
jgi:hypothetical protein